MNNLIREASTRFCRPNTFQHTSLWTTRNNLIVPKCESMIATVHVSLVIKVVVPIL